jgi:hypothetical protein
MSFASRYKTYKIYKPVRQEIKSGNYANSYEYVDTVYGRVFNASAMMQLVAQEQKQQISNVAKLSNKKVNSIGPGYIDKVTGKIGDIGIDWVIVSDRSGMQYKVVTKITDEEHETDWLTVTCLLVKDLVTV